MKHSHAGKYKCRTPKGRIIYKKKPVHKHTKSMRVPVVGSYAQLGYNENGWLRSDGKLIKINRDSDGDMKLGWQEQFWQESQRTPHERKYKYRQDMSKVRNNLISMLEEKDIPYMAVEENTGTKFVTPKGSMLISEGGDKWGQVPYVKKRVQGKYPKLITRGLINDFDANKIVKEFESEL